MSFNRQCIVEFVTPLGTSEFDAEQLQDIDVKFKIDLPMGAVLSKADISICNLKRANIEYLTTYTSLALALQERKRIRLFAGYDDTQTELIFDGDIYEAVPTQPPDIWLECKAQSGNYDALRCVSQSILVPCDVQSVCSQAAGWFGMGFDWQATTKKQLKKFDFTGNRTKLISELNKLDDIIVFDELDTLVVVDRNAPFREGTVREISEQTGMIGIPKVDFIGMEATLFLDTKIKRGDKVNLTSSKIPAANGLYYVYNISHEGHLRGTNWYTTIKARRLDAYGSEL